MLQLLPPDGSCHHDKDCWCYPEPQGVFKIHISPDDERIEKMGDILTGYVRLNFEGQINGIIKQQQELKNSQRIGQGELEKMRKETEEKS